MAEDDQQRGLRDELARLDVEMADGERNADDVASMARRRSEVVAEMERLGIGADAGPRRATTYDDPH